MDSKYESANKTITEALYRIMISNATIQSALELPQILPDFQNSLFHAHITGQSPAIEVLEQISQGKLSDGIVGSVAKALAKQAAVNAETVIAAAVIVLAHSTADDAFTGACSIAIDLEPEAWKNELSSDKKIRLGDFLELGMDGIIHRELDLYKKRLGGKSLPVRATLLFSKIPIKKHSEIVPSEDAYYKGSKMEDADSLRHAIVHGPKLPVLSIEKSRAVTSFLFEAATTAFRSVAAKFKMPFDMNHFASIAGIKNRQA